MQCCNWSHSSCVQHIAHDAVILQAAVRKGEPALICVNTSLRPYSHIPDRICLKPCPPPPILVWTPTKPNSKQSHVTATHMEKILRLQKRNFRQKTKQSLLTNTEVYLLAKYYLWFWSGLASLATKMWQRLLLTAEVITLSSGSSLHGEWINMASKPRWLISILTETCCLTLTILVKKLGRGQSWGKIVGGTPEEKGRAES